MSTHVLTLMVALALLVGCADDKKQEPQQSTKKAGMTDSVMAVMRVAAPRRSRPAPRVQPARASAMARAEPAASSWKKVPNIKGFTANVPAVAIPNGWGGSAGFHSKDRSFGFYIRHLKGKEAARTYQQDKRWHEKDFVKKWIRKEKIGKGWLFVYKGLLGPHTFYLRFEHKGQKYVCYTNLALKKFHDLALKACLTLRKE